MGWLPNYSLNYSAFDLIAGITVGLTIIPQSIAYAGVAGLPFEVRILNLIRLYQEQLMIHFQTAF